MKGCRDTTVGVPRNVKIIQGCWNVVYKFIAFLTRGQCLKLDL